MLSNVQITNSLRHVHQVSVNIQIEFHIPRQAVGISQTNQSLIVLMISLTARSV
jgi:hypothetical protein